MKQETMNILFFILKGRLLKNGEAPVLLRVTIGGVSDQARIQRSTPPSQWHAAKDDPFAGKKFRQVETQPVFLTMDELETMMKKEFAVERLEIVRDIFVFCAMTGLAFADAKGLKPEHIFTDNNGALWIRKGREKMKRRQGASSAWALAQAT